MNEGKFSPERVDLEEVAQSQVSPSAVKAGSEEGVRAEPSRPEDSGVESSDKTKDLLQSDLEAELSKWKKRARQKESELEKYREKADAWDKAQEDSLTEMEKLQLRAEKAEQALVEQQQRLLKAEIAAETGIPANLLSGSSEEELRAQATALTEWKNAQLPRPGAVGIAGKTAKNTVKPQLTRHDLEKMTDVEVLEADRQGLLNQIKGIN